MPLDSPDVAILTAPRLPVALLENVSTPVVGTLGGVARLRLLVVRLEPVPSMTVVDELAAAIPIPTPVTCTLFPLLMLTAVLKFVVLVVDNVMGSASELSVRLPLLTNIVVVLSVLPVVLPAKVTLLPPAVNVVTDGLMLRETA